MPTPPPPPPRPSAGPWVARWLSAPRHAVYLATAGDDHERALALYEWNAQVSAALFRDLAHVEIGLRNTYDRSLSQGRPEAPHWTSVGETSSRPYTAVAVPAGSM